MPAPGASSGSFDAASREAIRQKKLKTAPSHGWARGLAPCDLARGWQAVGVFPHAAGQALPLNAMHKAHLKHLACLSSSLVRTSAGLMWRLPVHKLHACIGGYHARRWSPLQCVFSLLAAGHELPAPLQVPRQPVLPHGPAPAQRDC